MPTGIKKTHSAFLEEIKNRKITPLEKYIHAKSGLLFLCEKCGNRWRTSPDVILGGSGCPKCAIRGRKRRENKVLADHGVWLEVDISTVKFPGATMKIDKADWNRIKETGHISATKGRYTLYASCGKNTRVHRHLFPSSGQVDHANGDGLDNRRSNLRECTPSQNGMNKTRLLSSNTSGVTGVYKNKRTGRWIAQIKVNQKMINLGASLVFEDAVAMRSAAEKKLFGEFSSHWVPD